MIAKLSRLQFVGLAASVAAAATAGPWAARRVDDLVTGRDGPKRLVVPGELGIDLHTVRDAVARRDRAVVDPRTGSRLPGGFRGVFAALAEYGYKTVELAGYDQGANGRSRLRRSGRCSRSTG